MNSDLSILFRHVKVTKVVEKAKRVKIGYL